MRILVVSNLYPPHHVGGYELGCRDVVEKLISRGHDVHVLTSTYSTGGSTPPEPRVHRVLRLHNPSPTSPFWYVYQTVGTEIVNQWAFRRFVQQIRPDLIYFWNLSNLSIALVTIADRLNLPRAIYVSDPWFGHWDRDRWATLTRSTPTDSTGKRMARRTATTVIRRVLEIPSPTLLPTGLQFTSDWLQQDANQNNKETTGAEVIRWGVDTAFFSPPPSPPPRDRLLFVGRLHPTKGVHTVIRALGLLPRARRPHLTIAGTGADAYVKNLQSIAAEAGVSGHVTFTGQIERIHLPTLYTTHGVLVFPSEWDEPFSIGLLEAMASGMAIITTLTGGTPELIRSGENALTFAPADPADCAHAINQLLEDEGLYLALRREARRSVAPTHDIETMVDRIENHLMRIAKRLTHV